MKSLVLCEKPSVAREIARVLGCNQKQKHHFEGSRYVVTWALGHLVELAEPEDYDHKYKTWKLEDLPLLPPNMKLKVIRNVSQQYRGVAALCKRSDLNELIIATDAGREGELVARWVMELVKWRKPYKRLWISSQTDKAIRDGFNNLRNGTDYDNLYSSAVCRAEADWLIGLNVTRALTCKYDAQLSAGRVQTPTLATLMNREREINEFRPSPYWTVTARLGAFRAQWRAQANHNGRLFEQAKAEAIVKKLQSATAKVAQLNKTEKLIPPPLAYDLTELQRDANKRFGFSAKQTSNVLQRLYEQHKLVTYPRTDSRHLSSDMVPTLKGRLESVAVGPYSEVVRPLLRKNITVSKRIVDDRKVTDHHAIIPTEQYVNLSALSPEERKLYDLIVRRFIALFYAPYKYEETSLVLEAAGEKLYSRGRTVIDTGWKEVYGSSLTAPDENDDDDQLAESQGEQERSDQSLPALQSGQVLPIQDARAAELMTKPPGRYTEASLLTQMEKHNLGTPATRADIIEKLLQTDTIERKQQLLVPTAKGKQLIELVAEELRSPELTAEWEQELERIARGQGNRQQFMKGIRELTVRLVREVKTSDAEYKPHNLTHSKCPDCNTALMERNSKRGKMLVCSNRECSYRRAAEPVKLNKRCPQCRKKMELRDGKAGKFAQCRSCNVIEKLDGQSSRTNKRQEQKLIKQFSNDAPLTSSLADALKAALEKTDE